jgi:rare lipoprotein A
MWIAARSRAHLVAIASTLLVSWASPASGRPGSHASERDECMLQGAALAHVNAAFTDLHGITTAFDRATVRALEIITGAASYYDEPGLTSSGEPYDARAFTAAAQIDIRHRFGGIRYGRNYQPSYGVAEFAGKKAIVKFNDVGPLRPGRAFDFSRITMEYFGGIERGVLPDVTVALLPRERTYPQGPITDAELAALGIFDAAEETLAGIERAKVHVASRATDGRAAGEIVPRWSAEDIQAAVGQPEADDMTASISGAARASSDAPARAATAAASSNATLIETWLAQDWETAFTPGVDDVQVGFGMRADAGTL